MSISGIDEHGRTDPPLAGNEIATLRGFLDYHRQTLRYKTSGLTREQLSATHPPSTMTLIGMLKHLAFVEDWWFNVVLTGNPAGEPFDDVDWSADPDWDWHSAVDDAPDDVLALWEGYVARSDRLIDAAPDGLETVSARPDSRTANLFSLRWILVHMIEEYARHNGHADVIREAVDGSVGE